MFAHALKRHPLLLKGIVPGTLAIGCGDVICQQLEGKDEIAQERTARMMITGALCVSPMAWFVNRSVNAAVPGHSLGALVKKSLAQASACVLFIVGSFTGNNALQGRSTKVLQTQLSERLAPTYALGFGYWTAAGLLLPQGLGFAVMAQTIWSIAMSRALNMKTPAVAAAVAAEQRQREQAAAQEAKEERRTANASGAFFDRIQLQQQQKEQQQQKH